MTYTHADALIETAWLADHLQDTALRIVDASYFVPGGIPPALEQFAAGHIPGAVFFNINDIADPNGGKDHAFPDAATFAAKVGALGIGNQHHVVAYDSQGGACAAARVWFMFRAFGHAKVSVLNGGLGKWKAEGRPISIATSAPQPQTFRAGDAAARLRRKADMLINIQSKDSQTVDARSAGRFAGTEPEPRAGLRSGHIPGARNVPFAALFDKDTMTFKNAAGLKGAFDAAGVDLGKPIVMSCGSGVTACTVALGAYLIGASDTAIYDGSWVEWGSDPDLPLESGPAR